MAAVAVLGIDGSSSVIEDFGTSLLSSESDGVVGIVYHQLLAEGIDEAAGTARNGNFYGIELLDSHRVA